MNVTKNSVLDRGSSRCLLGAIINTTGTCQWLRGHSSLATWLPSSTNFCGFTSVTDAKTIYIRWRSDQRKSLLSLWLKWEVVNIDIWFFTLEEIWRKYNTASSRFLFLCFVLSLTSLRCPCNCMATASDRTITHARWPCPNRWPELQGTVLFS